jgi:D-glycero-alpha-D-manno-heptose 1-phosphate guanylyltransferase
VEAIVLAGGMGTRLRPVVSDVPKPMAPVQGRPFLEWLLEYWIEQGVRRFILSVGYLAERISSHFGSQWNGAEIAYALETTPLGTGGGLLAALAEARAPEVLVLNGDTFFAVPLAELAARHHAAGADWTIGLFRSNDVERYLGIATRADGRIAAFGAKSAGAEVLVNGGVYLVRRGVLRDLPWRPGAALSLEADLLPHGLAAGWHFCGAEFRAPFIDIGVPQDYHRAGALLGNIQHPLEHP